MARKSLYQSRVFPRLAEIQEWARDGYSDKEIAQILLVSENSFSSYKKLYPELRSALEEGKYADTLVENQFFKSCIGYKVNLKVPFKIRVGNSDVIRYFSEEKYIPPNVKAQILWLKNRRPDKWSDKKEFSADSSFLLSDADRSLLQSVADFLVTK